jgi:hypothetical protein
MCNQNPYVERGMVNRNVIEIGGIVGHHCLKVLFTTVGY